VSLDEIRALKKQNREEKQELSTERDAVRDAKAVIEEQKATIERKEGQKQELLAIKRSTKQTYEQRLAAKQQRARQIRSALFALRDTAAIPFGKALTYANQASEATGVRPAFLLAILKQESELGQNVGTCNRPGDPPSKSWREIMPGPEDNSWRNDITAFKKITNELGRDPNGLPLSCPMYGGWGGAMGPSQFIPTTWLQYKPRVESALGVAVADPWEPRHAFTASALYLADLGAHHGGYTAERRAALKYYAGGNWNLPKNAFYGNQVMRKAQDIQQNMIDPLQDVN
jgi:membrane-bound lytic murein transglycosylase B